MGQLPNQGLLQRHCWLWSVVSIAVGVWAIACATESAPGPPGPSDPQGPIGLTGVSGPQSSGVYQPVAPVLISTGIGGSANDRIISFHGFFAHATASYNSATIFTLLGLDPTYSGCCPGYTGTLGIAVYSDNHGTPDLLLSSGTSDFVNIDFRDKFHAITFAKPVSLTIGNIYWFAFAYDSAENNTMRLGAIEVGGSPSISVLAKRLENGFFGSFPESVQPNPGGALTAPWFMLLP